MWICVSFCNENFISFYKQTMIEIEKIVIAIRSTYEYFAFRHITFRETLLKVPQIVNRIQILLYCIYIPRVCIVLLMTLLYKTFMEFKGFAKLKLPTLGLRYFPKEQLRKSLPNAFRINICSLLSCVIKYAPGMLNYFLWNTWTICAVVSDFSHVHI